MRRVNGSVVEQARLGEHLLVIKSDALVGARVVEVPARRTRCGPGESELLVVSPLVDDAGTWICRVGAVEVRQVGRRGGHVTHGVLVEAGRPGQVVTDSEPPEWLEVGRSSGVQVVAQRHGLAQEVMLFVEAADLALFGQASAYRLLRGTGRQWRPRGVRHPVLFEQLEGDGTVPFLVGRRQAARPA